MGLLNGILKGIRDACDALIDEEGPEPLPSDDPYKRGKQCPEAVPGEIVQHRP